MYGFYQEVFMRLSHQIEGLSEEFLVRCFVSGLRDAIKYDIIMKNSTTRIETMQIARLE